MIKACVTALTLIYFCPITVDAETIYNKGCHNKDHMTTDHLFSSSFSHVMTLINFYDLPSSFHRMTV